jgi:hypothetical protein
LSGKPNEIWCTISQECGISYHTESSLSAVRYLGYPLYSSTAQLLTFLTPMEHRIARHCLVIQQHSLSVKRSALLANSLIFSTLWHLLRVVTVPESWLDKLCSIVRKFLFRFWSAPSWDSACSPKIYGGLNVIDVHQQQKALQIVYIQHLLRTPRSIDFLSPLMLHCLQMYTGHVSFLSWLQHPNFYISMFRCLPTMKALTLLLTLLPPLFSSHHWPGYWLDDTPLRQALISLDSSRFDASKIPVKYLVSDALAWSPSNEKFCNADNTTVPRRGMPSKVYDFISGPDPPIIWVPLVKRLVMTYT